MIKPRVYLLRCLKTVPTGIVLVWVIKIDKTTRCCPTVWEGLNLAVEGFQYKKTNINVMKSWTGSKQAGHFICKTG